MRPCVYLDLDSDFPEIWRVGEIAAIVRNGGLGVIPTDTVYAFVCDISSKQAIERLYHLKNMDPKQPLAMMCHDLSQISQWTRGFPNHIFRQIRRCLPGPYTFIVKASRETPRILLKKKRREVGVRIPNDPVCQALLEELDRPLLCSSVRTGDNSVWNDPARISETYSSRIDFVIDAGERLAEPSTIIDLTDNVPVLVRHGKGDPDLFV